jgi:hypothetical protein
MQFTKIVPILGTVPIPQHGMEIEVETLSGTPLRLTAEPCGAVRVSSPESTQVAILRPTLTETSEGSVASEVPAVNLQSCAGLVHIVFAVHDAAVTGIGFARARDWQLMAGSEHAAGVLASDAVRELQGAESGGSRRLQAHMRRGDLHSTRVGVTRAILQTGSGLAGGMPVPDTFSGFSGEEKPACDINNPKNCVPSLPPPPAQSQIPTCDVDAPGCLPSDASPTADGPAPTGVPPDGVAATGTNDANVNDAAQASPMSVDIHPNMNMAPNSVDGMPTDQQSPTSQQGAPPGSADSDEGNSTTREEAAAPGKKDSLTGSTIFIVIVAAAALLLIAAVLAGFMLWRRSRLKCSKTRSAEKKALPHFQQGNKDSNQDTNLRASQAQPSLVRSSSHRMLGTCRGCM